MAFVVNQRDVEQYTGDQYYAMTLRTNVKMITDRHGYYDQVRRERERWRERTLLVFQYPLLFHTYRRR